uniref:Uncharacterized protein n=1 Tax=Solanum lycopersicum TaxID=4081 RepID=A0A3Q7JJ65_SOLLC
MNQEVASLAL